MYKLIHSLTTRELLRTQLPALALALTTAELFYKFHSFTLECAAFLATWYVYDALGQRIASRNVRDEKQR